MITDVQSQIKNVKFSADTFNKSLGVFEGKSIIFALCV